MKKLDWYILRKFLGTFFFILTVIMLIAVVFDISEKIDDFISKSAPLNKVIFQYYVNFIFYYGNLFSSLLIFLSVLYFTSQMAQRSEIVAILSSGVSFRRMLRPYFIGASILVVISLYFTQYQLPIANKTRLQFEDEYVHNKFNINERNLHREISPGNIAYFETFSAPNKMGYKFSLEHWEKGKLQKKLLADRAYYDTTNGKWNVVHYFIRTYNGEGKEEGIKTGAEMDTLINLKPADFGQRLNIASSMSWSELNTYIKKIKLRGSDKAVFYEIEKHQRTSYPMATYILTLIGVSIASRKSRGGTGLHLAMGVLLVMTYIFFMKVATVAATNAGLNAFIAVWIPNVIFGIIAIYLYLRAQK